MDWSRYYFILEDGQTKAVPFAVWLDWIEADADFSKRRVGLTVTKGYEISTVFLAQNHRFLYMGEGEPILFETLVFKDDKVIVGTLRRYSTLEEAMSGHNQVVALIESESTIYP